MPEKPHCPICLEEFNDTERIPYIGCQKGGHAFCKDCIFDIIPKSRHLDVTRIHEEPHAVSYYLTVKVPMTDCQIQFNCPICREKIHLYHNEDVNGAYPIIPVFSCPRIPLRYLEQHTDTPSHSIEKKNNITHEITSKIIQLKTMASIFADMVTDFKETVLNRKFNTEEKEMRETIEKNKDAIMGEMYRQARIEVQAEMKDERKKMILEIKEHRIQTEQKMIVNCRKQEEKFKIAMDARKDDAELTYQIRRKNLQSSLDKLNSQYEKMKENATETTQYYYELGQFHANRKEFEEYVYIKKRFTVSCKKFYPETKIIPDEEIMMWSNLIGLLDSHRSDSCKISIEDYMEFRLKNKNAQKNGEYWTNYSLDLWLNNKIKTRVGFTDA